MFRLSAILLLFVSSIGISQPPLNQWYSFGKTQSILGSVIATDSCYYAIGLGASTVSGIWDAGFYKFDLNGNVLVESYLHNDTVSINHMSTLGNPFISTSDGNFVALASQFPYFRFTKYTPSGDTIYSKLITEIYLNDGFDAYQPADILQLEDGSFTCSGYVAYNSNMQGGVTFFNLNSSGDYNFSNTFFCENIEFTQHIPAGIIKTTGGYLLATSISKVGYYSDEQDYIRLIELDNLGNEINTKTYWGVDLELFPRGIIPTGDGGYIHGGMVGAYNAPHNSLRFLGMVVKLDENLNREWLITLCDSTSMSYLDVNNIVTLDNGYVASGYSYVDSMICGWMFNIDFDGQVIWDSYFSFVPDTSFNFPEHRFYDMKQTPDKGFIMVGEAWNVQATFEGTPGRFGWIVKTDSVGCLVPGCQDFFGVDEIEKPTVQLSLYPNPTSNLLNIYFNDPAFNGNTIMQVFDMQGKLIREWSVTVNDITFMYDVSMLPAGAYILKLAEGGVEKATQKFVVE